MIKRGRTTGRKINDRVVTRRNHRRDPVEVEKTKDTQWFQVWCEEKDMKRKIWESRSKWEEKEMVVVEE